MAQVHLGAAWLHLSGARALPNTAPAGDGTAREGTHWVARAPTWAVQGYCHSAANPNLWNTHRQVLGGWKSVLGMEMAGKAGLGPHGPGSGHIHRSPSPGVSPFTPGWAVPPGWSHSSSGCHTKNLTSIPPPMTPLSQLMVTWLSWGDRAHCWPQPHTSPLQGTAVSPTAPPNPLQGGAFPNLPLACPSPPTSPSGRRNRRPQWGLSPACPPCQAG